MKQAKFALTSVALLAVIGGALAFKAQRQNYEFHSYTTTLVGGKVTGACIPTVFMNYRPNSMGSIIITVSSAETTVVTTCTARVIQQI